MGLQCQRGKHSSIRQRLVPKCLFIAELCKLLPILQLRLAFFCLRLNIFQFLLYFSGQFCVFFTWAGCMASSTLTSSHYVFWYNLPFTWSLMYTFTQCTQFYTHLTFTFVNWFYLAECPLALWLASPPLQPPQRSTLDQDLQQEMFLDAFTMLDIITIITILKVN